VSPHRVQTVEGSDSSPLLTRDELLSGLERGERLSLGTLMAAVDDGRLTDDDLAPHLPDLSAFLKSFTVQLPDMSAMVKAQLPDMSWIDNMAKSWNQNLSNAASLLNFDSVLGDLPRLAASIPQIHIPVPDFAADLPPSLMSSGATVDITPMVVGPTVAVAQLAVLEEVRADTRAMALIARASGEQIQAMAVNAETVKNEVRNQRWLTVILVLCTIASIVVAVLR